MCLQAHAHYRKTPSQENEIRETQSSKVTFRSGSLSSTQSVLHSHWYWWSSFVPGSLLLLLLSHFSHVPLYVTPRTAAHQAPLSLGFSRQEHWSGLPFPFRMHACMQSRFSRVRLCATPWTAVHQAPLSTGFSRQEFWSGLPFPSPGSLLGSGNKTETGSNRNPFSDLCSCHFLLFACL